MDKKKHIHNDKSKAQKGVMKQGTAQKRGEEPRERNQADIDMARSAAQGDPTARRELVERLLNPVRRTVTYMMGVDNDAEDMAQMALIQILRSAGAFRGDCSLEYWADRIAVRTVMKQIHKRRRREKLSAAVWEPPRMTMGIEDEASMRRVRIRLADLMQKLSIERRTAVALHHVQGYDLAEIAELTDTKLNTVRDRLRVGRKQLKKHVLRDPELREWADMLGGK